jgi:hypothetical protein
VPPHWQFGPDGNGVTAAGVDLIDLEVPDGTPGVIDFEAGDGLEPEDRTGMVDSIGMIHCDS